jgi:Domain of unknown function DUF29
MRQFDRQVALSAGEVRSIRRDEDFCGWLADQASLLRSRNYAALDSVNVAEELEEIAALQRDKVVSLLRVVLVHLLKWHYSKIRRSENSWKISLITARIDATDIIEDSRTLRNELPSLLVKAYRGARSVAGTEMRLAKRDWQRLFPDTCPWTESQVLDEDFFPEIAPGANGRS